MELINFENLPSTKTPINNQNLNQMQKNIKDAIDGVIESGSNENGSYVKFSDGTMICEGNATDTLSSGSTPANGVYYSSHTFTFPVAFVEKPRVAPSVSQNSGIYFPGLGNGHPTKELVQVRVLSMQQFIDIPFTFGYIAIGKWK